MDAARLSIAPVSSTAIAALERALGVSRVVAEVLVRRGLADPSAAEAWLAADVAHDPAAFGGMDSAVEAIAGHLASGTSIVVHGDYDVDGVSSTAILVRVLRDLGGDVSWYLPSRTEDGYGLARATVERLAAQGTGLLITVDCGITAVEEVALARERGVDVVVTDHHTPRADGRLPDAPIVHPRLGGYPCADLCGTGVAYLLARALYRAAGRDAAEADVDLDLVALATIADCVPLRDENRRLVREGLRALAATRRTGLRALMAVSRCDPSAVDATTCGFRLAPRINAAGRMGRADAGLELLLTDDVERARAIAAELDAANVDRRHVETRIRFEAEAQIAAQTDPTAAPAAYLLAGAGWHPGVIGIVASRLAERHHRPVVLVALPDTDAPGNALGTGSGRSIPGFDLLGGLEASAEHLVRYGGHRAAAGLTVEPARVDALRAAFVAHAEAALRDQELVPLERVDAVVAGDELGTELAEELGRLAPFGIDNPEVSLLVPAARLTDARPMGEGKHVRFTLESGGARARAVAFGTGRLPEGADDGAFDATFTLELNEWNGAVEPRLRLRRLVPAAPAPIALAGEPEDALEAALAECAAAPEGAPRNLAAAATVARDRRGGGIAGTVMALVATGEPVLVICADARARRRALAGRIGGFALCSWATLERTPELSGAFAHAVVLDPPAEPRLQGLLDDIGGRLAVHLAWGEPELAFTVDVHRRDLDLRPALRRVYAALRDARDGDLTALAGELAPVVLGRALRVLTELDLVVLDAHRVRVPAATGRTELERSAAFRAYQQRLEEGLAWLSSRTTARAA